MCLLPLTPSLLQPHTFWKHPGPYCWSRMSSQGSGDSRTRHKVDWHCMVIGKIWFPSYFLFLFSFLFLGRQPLFSLLCRAAVHQEGQAPLHPSCAGHGIHISPSHFPLGRAQMMPAPCGEGRGLEECCSSEDSHWDSSRLGGKQCFPIVPIEPCLHQTEISSSNFLFLQDSGIVCPFFELLLKWPLLAWMETSESLSSVSREAPLCMSTGPVNRLQV